MSGPAPRRREPCRPSGGDPHPLGLPGRSPGRLPTWLLLLLAGVASTTGGHVRALLQLTAGLSMLAAARNLIPRTRRGLVSDGRQALDAWRALRGSFDFEEAWRRHTHVLLREAGAPFRSHERLEDLVAGVGRLLGVDGPPQEDSVSRAAVLAAFHGCCWRHVEPATDERDPSVERALNQAIAPGRSPREARVAAACRLSRDGWETVTPLPGADVAQRHAARERLLTAVSADLGLPALGRDGIAVSFRYGLALHDLERSASLV